MSTPVASTLIIDGRLHSTIWSTFHRHAPNNGAASNLWIGMWETIGSDIDEAFLFHLLLAIQNKINP